MSIFDKLVIIESAVMPEDTIMLIPSVTPPPDLRTEREILEWLIPRTALIKNVKACSTPTEETNQ